MRLGPEPEPTRHRALCGAIGLIDSRGMSWGRRMHISRAVAEDSSTAHGRCFLRHRSRTAFLENRDRTCPPCTHSFVKATRADKMPSMRTLVSSKNVLALTIPALTHIETTTFHRAVGDLPATSFPSAARGDALGPALPLSADRPMHRLPPPTSSPSSLGMRRESFSCVVRFFGQAVLRVSIQLSAELLHSYL